MSDLYESTRRAFEDGVRDAWTIGYVCPRMGEGYENVHVNAMWTLWKKALTLSHPDTQAVGAVYSPVRVEVGGRDVVLAEAKRIARTNDSQEIRAFAAAVIDYMGVNRG